MPDPDQYRQRAKECVELAQHVSAPDRQRLLHIARVWLLLADENAKAGAISQGGLKHRRAVTCS